ncbi:hypothetical protein [Actinacidiphila oryziradicis]|uniref:hypothetical protein n=1 Tax=Actinacidiphila oryziradicis TaxID=2571141 RepID=UPI0023F56D13|nr:hypothetical protein [Actinacidiphila oryziradicis]
MGRGRLILEPGQEFGVKSVDPGGLVVSEEIAADRVSAAGSCGPARNAVRSALRRSPPGSRPWACRLLVSQQPAGGATPEHEIAAVVREVPLPLTAPRRGTHH